MAIIIILLVLSIVILVFYYETKIKKLKADEEKVEEKELANEFLQINFRFLENISHELRTPLNGIIGTIDLLKHSETNINSQKNIDILEKSSKNLLRLVNQIVSISKLHLDKTENEIVDVNIRDFIFDMREIFYGKTNASIECSFFVADEVPLVLKMDRIKLKQILFELLINAFKFTDQGDVSLIVRLAEKDNLEITVKDTGIGIMEQNLSKIFNVFSKNLSIKHDYSGIGLGLSTVKRLLELVNGEITVNSKYGAGTEFIITIPFEVAKSSKKDIRAEGSHEKRVVLFMGYSTKNILIQEMLSEKNVEFEIVDDIDDFEETEICDDTILIIEADYDEQVKIKEIIAEKQKTIKLILLDVSENNLFEDFNVTYLSRFFRQEKLIETLFDENILNFIDTKKSVEKLNSDKFRVAVIEDNKYNLEIIKQMFSHIEADVSYFDTGEKFLSDLSKNEFDMIFLDIQLPDMTGFDIIKIIRKKEEATKCFVTALTAHSFDGYREKCLEAGFDSYLTKPFKMNDLFEEIKNAGINVHRTVPNDEFDYKAPEVEDVESNENLVEEEESTISNKQNLKNILLEVYDSDFIQMRDAFLKKDLKTIKYFAHKLKGSFSIAGEMELADIFAEIEIKPEGFNLKTIKQIEKYMNIIRMETYEQNLEN